MQGTALKKLCDILIEQNIAINSAIKRKKKFGGKWQQRIIRTLLAKPVRQPKPPKKSRKEIEQENEYEKLVQRVKKFKEDKLQQQMEDENDELVDKLIEGTKKKLLLMTKYLTSQARFRRRSFHEPNLIH